MSRRLDACSISDSENVAVQLGPAILVASPVAGFDHPAGMHLLCLVVLGWAVAPALLRDDVNQHRTVESAGPAQRRLDGVLVVPVDRPDILQTEIGEQQLRRKRVLHTGFDTVHELISHFAEERHAAHRTAPALQQMLVTGLQPQHGQMIGQTAERRRVTAAVVVDDDHHRPAGRRDIVQRLPAHATGEGAVADHRHHVPVAMSG